MTRAETEDEPDGTPGSLAGESLVPGTATGEVLFSDAPLSFWGGVDPVSGMVTDTHHPLHGQCVSGKIVALPSGRGSCSGSGAIVEMLFAGTAPAALVFSHRESILTVGVVVAEELFDRTIPVVRLDLADFAALASRSTATVVDGVIYPGSGPSAGSAAVAAVDRVGGRVRLSEVDRQLLDGDFGEAAQVAIRIVLRAAELEGATELIDVVSAHVDGVFYQGPGSLAYAVALRDLGARVRVPTTMNAICVDRHRWRDQRVPATMGEPSEQLADAYEQMGVRPTYTCAPYLLAGSPRFGQQIATAESNVVQFANSVIGARTMKYPDYLDLLIAITGRAPLAGQHLDAERRATVVVEVGPLAEIDDCLFPVLGYHVGKLAPNDIPAVCGLEAYPVSRDDLKAFGAAFATTSAAAMFHLVGVTPEASTVEQATGGMPVKQRFVVGAAELRETWLELNSAVADLEAADLGGADLGATGSEIDLVSLGNPHFSLSELAALAGLVAGRSKNQRVQMIVTCGREVYSQARAAGYVETIEQFGGSVICDTCWCFIEEPVIPPAARAIVTNSAKYAHYGAAGLGLGMHLRSLRDCVEAACTGQVPAQPPRWLLAE
ncbi:MAG: aconitase X [Microlunatus sp.]